mmetsp:Transcript_4222/g.12185  ORF Transcript_4222/g.12185 Transcript_4222/m.12185 type:complete len:296 (-) Transcript_4222:1637-2524(-)
MWRRAHWDSSSTSWSSRIHCRVRTLRQMRRRHPGISHSISANTTQRTRIPEARLWQARRCRVRPPARLPTQPPTQSTGFRTTAMIRQAVAHPAPLAVHPRWTMTPLRTMTLMTPVTMVTETMTMTSRLRQPCAPPHSSRCTAAASGRWPQVMTRMRWTTVWPRLPPPARGVQCMVPSTGRGLTTTRMTRWSWRISAPTVLAPSWATCAWTAGIWWTMTGICSMCSPPPKTSQLRRLPRPMLTPSSSGTSGWSCTVRRRGGTTAPTRSARIASGLSWHASPPLGSLATAGGCRRGR